MAAARYVPQEFNIRIITNDGASLTEIPTILFNAEVSFVRERVFLCSYGLL
jgi:hypothetical protein